MSKQGTITFEQRDDDSLFMYSYEISNFHAAKILEYIGRIPNVKSKPFRDSKGRFIKPMIKRLVNQTKDKREQ
jgi:hypothetical protein